MSDSVKNAIAQPDAPLWGETQLYKNISERHGINISLLQNSEAASSDLLSQIYVKKVPAVFFKSFILFRYLLHAT